MTDERLEMIRAEDEKYVMHTYRRLPVAFVRGEGTRLWDTAGREYLDLVGGLGVMILGHSHPRIVDAIQKQAALLIHTTNLYYVQPQVEIARLLVENTFAGKCFFANSGAEANEGALKLARKFHYRKGRQRSKVVCALGSFHGRTLATLSATGHPAKWEPFGPVFPGFVHVDLNDSEALDREVDADTSAVLLEPIQGESGVHPASVEFIRAARSACDREGAVLILDEVQCGMGRTGKLFAYEDYGIEPDLMTVAKGLANGVPAAAFLAGEETADVLEPGDHGTTFGGGFLACAAAAETLKVLMEDELAKNASEVGGFMIQEMKSMVGSVPHVSGARGRGLMLALQLDEEIARSVVLGCLERGVLVNDATTSIIRMLPPLVLSRKEASSGLDAIRETLHEIT